MLNYEEVKNLSSCGCVMELWDDWDDFLKVIASDQEMTVDQEAVFLVRLSRQSIDRQRTNQDIANEVIGGEPNTALYAYNKRMKEVFDKLSQSFPEINSESRGKVDRTQACLEKAYLEQQNQKKSEVASHAIAPTDWHKICHDMLEAQKQNLRRQITQMGFELNIHVPLGLVDRKQQSRRSSDFSLPPEQGSGFFHLSEEEIIKTYEHNEFLEQVIKQGQSKKSQGKRIAIIGEPGAGKTTLLEAIAFCQNLPYLPIWISLGSLGEKSLEECLCQKWLKDALKTSDVTQQQKALEELFKSGEVLLLLDGVDEMSAPSPVEALAKIREELTGWVAGARVVLTCRVNVWDASVNALQGFDTYRTLEFSYGDGNKPDQVREFICQWFSKAEKPELGEKLREKLEEDRNQRIQDLVKNPMRLSLLCQSWYFHQGDLPETKAALYEQFTRAFYDWKEDAFRTTLTERKELNTALGLLAREAIDKKKSRFGIGESFALELMGEDLFNLACKLHWLNFVYRDAETDEKVYAFFHPTFQEYFAACAIDDWHFFLNHICQNPQDTKASYRIFAPHWKEVIMLWLGREIDKEFRKQKEAFIDALVEFQDRCGDFYSYKAYFLAAVWVAEFDVDGSIADDFIAQVVKFGFGCFDDNQENWFRYHISVEEAAKAILNETDSKKTIDVLNQLLRNVRNSNITLRDIVYLNVQSTLWSLSQNQENRRIVQPALEKSETSKSKDINKLIELIEYSQDDQTYLEIAYKLSEIDPLNLESISAILSKMLHTCQDEYILCTAAQVLSELVPSHPDAINVLTNLLCSSKNVYSLWLFASLLAKIAPGHVDAINALTERLHSQDEETRRQAAKGLSSFGKGNHYAFNTLINILLTTQDGSTRSEIAKCLQKILPRESFPAIITNLKQYITEQVYENDINFYDCLYQVIWHCAQHMNYPDFYQAWHSNPSPVPALENQLTDIPSQIQPTDKTYPIAINTQTLKLETNINAIAQKICTKIYRKASYSEIPTVNDAAQLQQYIPRIQEKVQKPNLALILHGCEPNEHLINFCYSFADLDIGIYISLITSQPIEQPLKGFLPNQDNLLSAIQSWINEIA